MGCNNYGAFLDSGSGGPSDPVEAGYWLAEAVAKKNDFTMNMVRNGLANFRIETRRAFQRELQRRGVLSGGIDGKIGQGTITAAQRLFDGR